MSFRYRHGDRPLEGYTIQRGVGRGGFGEVYYAVSDGGREVALKSIIQNRDIELRGVRHCINLKSPHLVSIFDVRNGSDGTPFVIMEYVAGPSIRDLVREHPGGLGAEKAAYLAREIARGLAYLHEQGIVHRDLKPENIFYEDGYVKIGDYGLSKYISVSRQSGQTMSVGTIHYMAPEIGSGVYSRGIDIYALGVILYELLTGRVPFTGDSFGEILMKHLTAEPDLAPLPVDFRAVVGRALAKKPEDRYATVDDLAKDLMTSDSLRQSVSLFNPATLSRAARRGETPVPQPVLQVVSPHAPTAAVSPPPREAPEVRRPVEPHRHRDHRRPAHGGEPPAHARVGGGYSANLEISPAEALAHDPLDGPQRGARAVFAVLASAIVGLVFGRPEQATGLVFAIVSATAAIVVTQRFLLDRFLIPRGLRERVVAAAVAFVPVAIATAIFDSRHDEEPMWGFLLGLLICDWRLRTDGAREERISVAHAFTAGFVGLLLASIGEEPLFTAGGLAGTSLLLEAWSPFVPRYKRRDLERARAGADFASAFADARATIDPTAPGVAAAAAPSPPSPATLAGFPGPAPAAPPVSPAEPPDPGRPPGPTARLAWTFLAATAISGGLSGLASLFFGNFRGDEVVAILAVSVGVIVLSGFGVYRGLWARKSGVWARTIRPFFLWLASASAVGHGVALAASPLFTVRFSDELFLIAIGFGCSLGFASFFFALERLAGELSTYRYARRKLVGPHRPVHPALRTAQLFLGTIGVVAALSLVIASRFAPSRDQVPLLLGAIGVGSLGAFFLRQGLRRSRGTFWRGTLRPFVSFLSVGGVVGSITALALVGGQMHGDEQMGTVIFMIFCAVFGTFARMVQGHQPSPPDAATLAALRRHGALSAPRAHPALGGAGVLLWLLGLPCILTGSAEGTGLFSSVFGRPLVPPYHHDEFVTIACALGALFCATGAFLSILSRIGSGWNHLARGVLGQAAFLLSVGLFLVAAQSVAIDRDFARFDPTSPDGASGLSLLAFGALALGSIATIWKPKPEIPNSSLEPTPRQEAEA